jgi:hypothetical protein
MSDTNDNLVSDIGTFTAPRYAVLTTSMQAVSVDTSKRGFLWKVFQNDTYTHTSLAETELALAGQLVDGGGLPVTENMAFPLEIGVALGEGVTVGPLLQFEIDTVINLSQNGLGGDAFGNFVPDDQMPGIPGINFTDDGIDAEIITFVDLPVGWFTMGVNSDDGFRAQAGYINLPADGVLLGEFDGGPSETRFEIFVQDAGIYPVRVIWQEGGGNAYIEVFTVQADGLTKVLLNDTANGGFTTYRSGVAPDKPEFTEFTVTIGVNGGNIEVSWTEPGLILEESADLESWSEVPGATSPYQPTITGNSAQFFRLRN